MPSLLVASIVGSISFTPFFASADPNCPTRDSLATIQQTAAASAQAVEKSEEAPFAFACHEPNDLRGRPATGFFHRAYPTADSQGRKASAFLRLLQNKVNTRIEENANMIGNLKRCLSDMKGDPRCGIADNWVKQELPKFLKDARFQLSLAQSPSEWSTWLRMDDSHVNSNLSNLGTYKEVPWQKLEPEELKESQEALDGYRQDIEAEALKRKKMHRTVARSNQFKSDSMISARYRHFLKYHEKMAQLPFAQYLTNAHPSDQELIHAADKFLENIEKEKAHSKKMEAAVAQAEKSGTAPTDAMELLAYSSLTEETLLEHPEFCGIATSLMYTSMNRGLQNMAMTTLPILAVSFFAPPLVGVAVGVASGGYFAYESHADLEATKSRAFSQLYADPSSPDIDEVERAYSARNMTVATLPLGYGLLSTAATKVGVGLRAAAVGFRIAGRSINTASEAATTTATVTATTALKNMHL